MQFFIRFYYSFYNWLIYRKDISSAGEIGEVERLLASVILTSPLMWSNTLNAYYTIDSPWLYYLGFVCTVIHMTTPLIYKLTGSICIAANLFLTVGVLFIYSFCYFDGGFFSPTTVWFSILPLLGGTILGRRMLIGWMIISVTCLVSLLIVNGLTLEIITLFGKKWTQVNISIGYLVTNFTLMYVYIHFKEKNKLILKAKNESIKKLLRIVSHDIANPLTVIITSSKILDKKLTADSNEHILYLDKIKKSTGMIKEILDHSRKLEALDSGKASYQAVELGLNDIIENSLFVFKSQMEEKCIQFEYDFEANKNVMLYGEPISIKNQVFNNLFSNAIKFIERGKRISINAVEENSLLIVNFSDQGCGMAPDTLKNIFRSDIKTSHKGLDGEEGTGFGMPLLHATLIELGANISVSSIQKTDDSENHGTNFKMQFKLKQ